MTSRVLRRVTPVCACSRPLSATGLVLAPLSGTDAGTPSADAGTTPRHQSAFPQASARLFQAGSSSSSRGSRKAGRATGTGRIGQHVHRLMMSSSPASAAVARTSHDREGTVHGAKPEVSPAGPSRPVAPSSTAGSSAASLLRVLKKDAPHPRRAPGTVPPVSSSTTPSSSPRAVSMAFLHQLLLSTQRKAIHWAAMATAHPELAAMPLYAERGSWTQQYASHRAASPDRETAPPLPVFLCTAPTGAGKSVLVTLYFLDAHWRAVAQKVRAATTSPATTTAAAPTAEDEEVLPLTNLAAFAARLKQSSRVKIVVSQPTRLACIQLATYTAALLGDANEHGGDGAQNRDGAAVGGRVGYAVGGETCFTDTTEIVYATPGYILNALHSPPNHAEKNASSSHSAAPAGRLLQPTTLIIDEAHCRDVETDLLLAWVRLRRAASSSPTRLRQVVVMSATLNAAAMIRYWSVHPEAKSAAHDRRPAAVAAPPPVWMLSAAQQQAVDAVSDGDAVGHVASAPPHAPHFVTTPDGTPRALHSRVLAAVASTSGETPYPVERYFIEDLAPPQGGQRGETSDTRHTRSSALAGMSPPIGSGGGGGAEPGRCAGLQSSRILFPWLFEDGAERSASLPQKEEGKTGRATVSRQTDRRRRPRSAPSHAHIAEAPLLLSQDGLALLHHLQSTFASRFFRKSPRGASSATAAAAATPAGVVAQTSVQLYGPQASRIAELVLQLLQALRLRREYEEATPGTSTPASVAEAHVPDTVLLFLPGFAEIQLVLQALERRCVRSLHSDADPSQASPADVDASEPILVLQHGKDTFSVPVLHTAAVGSPQRWLRRTGDTRTAPPLRLALATNLAESSVTIPGVRVVVDACLTRRLLADPITGTTRKVTTVATAGSLLQRGGRTGRTGPGVIIHLAPRAVIEGAGDGISGCKVETALEPLAESPAMILLRVKSLLAGPPANRAVGQPRWSTSVAAVLGAMPRPPSALELEAAYQQLMDMDLLLPPTVAMARHARDRSQVPLPLADRLNDSVLSPKGRLTALLPVPMECALLIFHALAFGCVEEALLVACAMVVPSLFTTPRLLTDATVVRTSSDASQPFVAAAHGDRARSSPSSSPHREDALHEMTLSPLAQYSRHLLTQRRLAGAVADGDEDPLSASVEGEPASSSLSSMESLSEPLMLRALMREWYACPSSVTLMHMQSRYQLNRSAMRNVDMSVARCCQRLLQCLAVDGNAYRGAAHAESPLAVDTEDDAHEYYVMSASISPSCDHAPTQHALPPLVDPAWPVRYRERLTHSLYRLRHAALVRAGHRLTTAHAPREGLPQWHGAEQELTSLVGDVFRGAGHDGRGRGRAETPLHPSLAAAMSAAPASTTVPSRRANTSLVRALTESLPLHKRRAELLAVQRDPSQSMFDMGTAEARLRAAYIAAFARHTLHGTDGGYRRHHRRLARNLDALRAPAGDEAIATFRLDLRGMPGAGERAAQTTSTMNTATQDRMFADAPSASRLSAALLKALRFFLGAERVAQVALFRERHTAVIRFATGGAPPESRGAVPDAGSASASVLLSAGTLPTRVYHALLSGSGDGEASNDAATATPAPVRLAPFGYSLLVAAQTVLQRQPIEVPSSSSTMEDRAAPATPDAARSPPAPPASAKTPVLTDVEDGVSQTTEVRWHHHAYGTPRALRRDEVAALGLAEWFPDALAVEATGGDGLPPRGVLQTASHATNADDEDDARHSPPPSYPLASLDSRTAHTQTALWGVLAPLNITRSIYWRVSLPSATAWWWRVRTRLEPAPPASEATHAPRASASVAYCPVCHVTCVGKTQKAAHCRSVVHLQHLHFAVQHGTSAAQLARVVAVGEDGGARGGAKTEALPQTPLLKALFPSSATSFTDGADTPEAPLPLEVYPCRLSPLSFLNALQSHAASPVAPLAVAGSLLSTSSSPLTSTSSVAAVAESTTLTAQHVWVVPPVVGARRGRRSTAPSPPVLSTGHLLTLAGFLTASTRRSPALFLFNASHTHVYAVQLRGRGMWSFTAQPLPVRELGVIAHMMDGRAWPGVFRDTRAPPSHAPAEEDAAPSRDGLHWCVPDLSGPCPHGTYFTPPTAVDATVVAVLLLVLQEYVQAQRRMVHLADYVERVVAKLDANATSSPGITQLADFFRRCQTAAHAPSRRADTAAGPAADSLVPLLQSVGCLFVTPPQALASCAVEASGREEEDDEEVGGKGSAPRVGAGPSLPAQALSPLALAIQGTSLEMQFTVPAVLPTYLPTQALYTLTQRFYEERGCGAAGAMRSAASRSGGPYSVFHAQSLLGAAPSKPPPVQF